MYPPPNLKPYPNRTKNMDIFTHIDWLSVTFPSKTPLLDIIPYRCHLVVTKSPIPVYNLAYEALPLGAKVMVSGSERLGTHLILSGKVLARLRDNGITGRMIYEHVKRNNGKFSRVDIALNITEIENIGVRDFLEKMTSCMTRLKGYKYIASDEAVETLYVGNMKSKSRKLRIYDKAIEQGIEDYNWIRIEYEKRNNADGLLASMFADGNSISSIIKSVIDFPDWGLYQEIINAEPSPIVRGKAKVDNREWLEKLNWICESAIPALADCMYLEAKEHVLEGDFNISEGVVMETFISVLNAEIAKKFKLGT